MLCEWSPFDMEGRIVWWYGGWGNYLANLQIDKFNDLLVVETKFGWRLIKSQGSNVAKCSTFFENIEI